MALNAVVNGASCISAIDAQTLQIPSICVISNEVRDAAVIADLLEQVPPNKTLLSLIGDGAYDTQSVYEVVIQRNAIPIIPPRKNARIRKGDAFAYRNAAVATCRHLGRRIWKVWSGYHRRSLMETKMNCIKRLAERGISITFEHQVNELHIQAAIWNRFTELGCPLTAGVRGRTPQNRFMQQRPWMISSTKALLCLAVQRLTSS